MIKRFNFRLYPNKEQATFFDKTIGCARFIYNAMLADRIKAYEQDGKTIKPTTGPYTKQYEFLKEVDSSALCFSQVNLNTAYTNFFKKVKAGKEKPGFPKFKSKFKSKLAYSTIRADIRIENGKIKLPKIGFVKIKQHRELPEGAIIKTCTIERTRTFKYFISMVVNYEQEIEQQEVKTATGLDYKMDGLYCDDKGNVADPPKRFRESQERLAFLQRSFCRKQKGSTRSEKARLRVAKMHEKIKNQRADYLHNESKRIADKNDLVAVEDLNMLNMAQCLRFGKSVNDNGWGGFVNMLEYKLADRGKHFVKVDKWFPSSKMCGECGKINDDLTLKDREWTCACGVRHDRDLNAARNILKEGLNVYASKTA